jgi:hypothetical protein
VRRALSALLILTSTITAAARAADIRTLTVEEHQGHYTVILDAVLDAPSESIFSTISDPGRWPELSHSVTKADDLGWLPDGRRKIRVIFEDCILIFCQTVHKNETLRSSANGHIETLTIPGQGDFGYAHEHWLVSAEGSGTRVRYQAEMLPSFYIPPLLGAYILKAKIHSLLLHVTTNLEAAAKP